MSQTREIHLDTIDRLNEIKADLYTVQAAIEGDPSGDRLACVGNTLYRVLLRYEDVLRECGEVPFEEPVEGEGAGL